MSLIVLATPENIKIKQLIAVPSARPQFVPVLKELSSSLMDRDRALCEKNELLEKYCHEVKDKAEAQKELSQACRDVDTVREERDVARKERTEAIIQRDQLLQEYYQARQVRTQGRFIYKWTDRFFLFFPPLMIILSSNTIVIFFFFSPSCWHATTPCSCCLSENDHCTELFLLWRSNN